MYMDRDIYENRPVEELLEELQRLRRRVDELESGTAAAEGGFDQCYRDLFGESKDAVYVSARDGRILDFNRAGAELFGYSGKEVIGMDISALYADPDEREKFQEEIEREGAVKDFEMKLRRKDGTIMDCLLGL